MNFIWRNQYMEIKYRNMLFIKHLNRYDYLSEMHLLSVIIDTSQFNPVYSRTRI